MRNINKNTPFFYFFKNTVDKQENLLYTKNEPVYAYNKVLLFEGVLGVYEIRC
jgi:hypothetical protein